MAAAKDGGKRGREELGGAIGCVALLVAFAIFVFLNFRGCSPAP